MPVRYDAMSFVDTCAGLSEKKKKLYHKKMRCARRVGEQHDREAIALNYKKHTHTHTARWSHRMQVVFFRRGGENTIIRIGTRE